MTPSVHVQGSGQVISSRQTETRLELATTKNVFPCRTLCLFSILTLHFQVSQWKVDSSTFWTTLDFATLKSTEKYKTYERPLRKKWNSTLTQCRYRSQQCARNHEHSTQIQCFLFLPWKLKHGFMQKKIRLSPPPFTRPHPPALKGPRKVHSQAGVFAR